MQLPPLTKFWKTIDHPTEGKLRTPAFPINFSETPFSIRRHQPNLGEHSMEILLEAGLELEEIEKMLKSGATKLAD